MRGAARAPAAARFRSSRVARDGSRVPPVDGNHRLAMGEWVEPFRGHADGLLHGSEKGDDLGRGRKKEKRRVAWAR